MLKGTSAVRAHVAEQLEQLRLNVFEQPPSDWNGFQQLLGAYQALLRLQAELTPPLNGEDS